MTHLRIAIGRGRALNGALNGAFDVDVRIMHIISSAYHMHIIRICISIVMHAYRYDLSHKPSSCEGLDDANITL